MGAIKTLKEVESALQKKNEANYVRALDAQGNPILISKEDLAEVVRGLIGISTSEKEGLFPYSKCEQTCLFSSDNILLYEGENRDWSFFGFLLTVLTETKIDIFIFSGSSRKSAYTPLIICRRILGTTDYEFFYDRNDKSVRIYIKQDSIGTTKYIHKIPMVGMNNDMQVIKNLDEGLESISIS